MLWNLVFLLLLLIFNSLDVWNIRLFQAIFCQFRTFCAVESCVVFPFHNLHFTPVSFGEESMVSFHIIPGGVLEIFSVEYVNNK